jgi:sulfhydrogenase subunit gamma (sulfur reductase)
MKENMKNPYLPMPVTLEKVTVENDAKDLKTLRFKFDNDVDRKSFIHKCGQFAILSVPGAGECPIGIASSPSESGTVEFTVKSYPNGVVSSALHGLEEGSKIGLRGPYGNSFPLDEMEGKNVVIVSGGFAFTTLRAAIKTMLSKENSGKYKSITVIYGARNPGELLYKEELKDWEKSGKIKMVITVDKGDKSWTGREGFVPAVLGDVAPGSDNAVALVCGPPMMLKYTIPVLQKLNFDEEKIYTSIERKMSCGMGLCGRCNVGPRYVCKHGPVFNLKEVKSLYENVF